MKLRSRPVVKGIKGIPKRGCDVDGTLLLVILFIPQIQSKSSFSHQMLN